MAAGAPVARVLGLKRLTCSRSIARLSQESPRELLQVFRAQYFARGVPAIIQPGPWLHVPGAGRWFRSGRLNYHHLQPHSNCIVPVEITAGQSADRADCPSVAAFARREVPLGFFLHWLRSPPACRNSCTLYLAQCQLLDLPAVLQIDFTPPPDIVSLTGRGDNYDTNLWLGHAPTYTPLHRDPNPNVLMQLAGTKVVRLCDPCTGAEIFQRVRRILGGQETLQQLQTMARFRGEEMMHGPETDLLRTAVWSKGVSASAHSAGVARGYEVTVGPGSALYIPAGWWHSVTSVENEVCGSINWWFR